LEYFDNSANDRELSVLRMTAGGGCEVVKDCIVPDAYSDVKKILASSVKLSPRADSVEDDGIVYSGTVTVTVVFLTEDGEVASMTIDSDYEGRALCKVEKGVLRTASFPTYEGFQNRLVNPRKIGIRLKIKPNLYLWEDVDTSVCYPDSVTDEDILTFEEKYARIGYTQIETYRADGVESGDDIHIEAPHAEISELLMKEIRFSSLSCEARSGAVAVNANAEILLWYLSENKEGEQELSTYRHCLPVSTLVECAGVKEGNTVFASLYWEDGSFSVTEDGQGERRLCECDFTYGVSVTAMKEAVGYVTKDLYSTRYDSELTYGELRIASGAVKATATSRAKMSIPLKEGFMPIALASVMKEAHIEAGEDGRAVVCGSASLFLTLQNRESLQYTAETSELSLMIPLSFDYHDKCEHTLTLTCGIPEYKSEGESVQLSLPVTCTAVSFMQSVEKLAISAKPIAECATENIGSFTVYYPAEQETPWDIAKKYRVSEDSLVFSEQEDGKNTKKRRVVMIVQKKKPLYQAVITP